MKKNLLTILVILFFNGLYAQNYFIKENGKFTEDKISVLSISPDKITIEVYYNSSERCACESEAKIEINKNSKGEFLYEINENPKNTIKISFTGTKLSLIEVVDLNGDYIMECCQIVPGKYYLKP